ncbi:hypothetical protein H0H81_003757 [Sphagnurus paluster]|uniref:Uncharacterized protein n=1 Tax=Sphagnurus paluster TaxID=117069 RepID=A0A9P7KM19_9AGAR|nr:hypothetical protein H0H81_003757 [Sphagnurus paluster]
MGNFKHQSLRASDRDRERDRDRDTDKDRERDMRDKDGHERLRHLSDKYDRDRLALPTSTRNKERDTAPHLSAGSTSRLGAQAQGPPCSSRRADTRDPVKKKAGEASEDWRKGADIRSTREERGENGRKDRDEVAKSRVRDSSRPRRDTSPSRRDRDDFRRDRDRDRDLDRDTEEDPRRWRDDGKRDERMATRRTDRHSDRLRDRDLLDSGDRRWVSADDRDGRAKRPAGRERKIEDGKDREDRRDREREKEPAWMDTYIPPPSNGTGILGGKAAGDGELDGIQAWKKERKEKEMKDQPAPVLTKAPATPDTAPADKPEANGKALDEIQLFRLLMKREEEKKKTDVPDGDDIAAKSPSVNPKPSHQSPIPASEGLELGHSVSAGRSTSTTPTPNSLLSLLGSKEPISSLGPQEGSQDAPKSSSNRSNNPPFQEHMHHDSVAPQFNPPPGSRLLAFARTPAANPRSQNASNGSTVAQNGSFSNLAGPHGEVVQQVSKSDALRSMPGFSPFEEQSRASHGLEDPRETGNHAMSSDTLRRAITHGFPTPEHPPFHDSSDNTNGYSASRGSRFAKFFDAKGRESSPATSKPHTPAGMVSSSPGPGGQRQDHGFNATHGSGPDLRAMDEIYAMLSSSAQGPRAPHHMPNAIPLSSNGTFGLQAQNNLHLLQQQQLQQQQLHANRLEPLYESRLDDRNFVPDGMVPGLRSAPPPRNRENPGIYPDDDIPFNLQQRIPPQPQRNLDQMYSGGLQSMYGQQGGRNPGIPLQQNHYRGGPSPISHQQNHLTNPQQQRLPPGLANLGGRPPHEPSQFIGMPGMAPAAGLHGALHLNGSNQQQPFNNFVPGGSVGYGTGPIRGPHQLQNPVSHLPIGGLGHPNIDLRTASQNQLLGMGGVGALRGTGGGFPGLQGPGAQQLPPLLAMRQQQQQQQLPPHMMSHLLPPHIQQQGPNSQPAHDLMALLMGNAHRE